VAQKALTVTGVTANDKIYDGNAIATLTRADAALVGVVGSDTVALDTATAVGAFEDKNVGSGKLVGVSGLTIGGANAGNYSLCSRLPRLASRPKVWW